MFKIKILFVNFLKTILKISIYKKICNKIFLLEKKLLLLQTKIVEK
jgi:hypothetical protein